MSDAPGRIFRASAIERLSSPEQLDQLVRMTRPFDWLAGAVLCLAVAILIVWGTAGRIAIRVSSEGMLIGDGAALSAVVYVPADHGKSIKPGMAVRIEASATTQKQSGALPGKVVRVSDFPVTLEGIAAVLHNDILVAHFSREPSYEVVVELQSNGARARQSRTGAGPPPGLPAGTLVRAEITISQRSPISLVLPSLAPAGEIGG